MEYIPGMVFRSFLGELDRHPFLLNKWGYLVVCNANFVLLDCGHIV